MPDDCTVIHKGLQIRREEDVTRSQKREKESDVITAALLYSFVMNSLYYSGYERMK